MRVYLCEHCLGEVALIKNDASVPLGVGWMHRRWSDFETCKREPMNPVPQLHVGAGTPDRQSMWEFERAELIDAFEREREHLSTAFLDAWRLGVRHQMLTPERYAELREIVRTLEQ